MNRPAPTSHLPSVYAAYRRVEAHLDRVAAFDPSASAGRSALLPLDALLASLLIQFHCRRATVIDLASEATLGSSTLLCAGQSTVRSVAVRRASGPPEPWRDALRESLEESAPDGLAPVEPIAAGRREPGGHPITGEPVVRPESLLVIQAEGLDRAGTRKLLEEGFALAPGAPALVLGLGRVGECPALSEILGYCDGSDARLHLFRELSGVVGSSRMGLVAPRQDAQVGLSLQRIEQFFASNFDYLRLVDGVCRAAMAATQLDEATQGRLRVANSPSGIDVEMLIRLFMETSREKLQLQEELRQVRASSDHLEEQRLRLLAWAEQTHDYQHLRDQLAANQATFYHRSITWVRRFRQVVAPEGSVRYTGYRKSRTAMRIWRKDGALGLVRHIQHRHRGPKTPSSITGPRR